jgi:PAS domain S-box-containing protein
MVTHLDARIARIWTVPEPADSWHPGSVPQLQASAGVSQEEPIPLQYSGSWIEQIVSGRRPRRVDDLQADPGQTGRPALERYALQTFAGYPLVCRETLSGVLAAYFSHPPSDLVLRALESAASNISLAVNRRSAERSQQVGESVPNGILVVNRDGAITLVNRQAEKMFGFDRRELIGQPVELLLPAAARAGHPEKRAGFFSDPRARAMGSGRDLFAVRKDGSEFPVEIGLNPIQTDGETAVLCSVVDITERKRGERALKESSQALEAKNAELAAAVQRSQQVIESAPNGILVVNRAGLITLANRQAETLFGFQRQELIGQPVEMLLPASLRAGHPKERAGFFSDPRARAMGSGRDLFAVRKDGSEFPVEIGLNPIQTDGEAAVLCSVADITERKKVEKKLLEAARLKSEFLANMSHEIRTPMNVLIGMSGLLMETSLNPEQRDYAETIRRGAESLLVVINDSLDFSKIEAGKLDIDPVDFDIDTLVEDVAEFLSQQSSLKGLELTCSVDPDVPASVHGDAARVRQILTNLVANAIKFTEKGEVNLLLRSLGRSDGGTQLRFEVRDTGIGIPPELQGRLFEPFTQADGSTTRKYGGTGLGLAICKRLVELMAGSIGFESEAGKGSLFWVELPFTDAPEPAKADMRLASLDGLRILVVDDNRSNLAIVKAYLESWQIKADLAQNAPQAMAMIREAARAGESYRLVILDYGMPGMNGIDLARVIRSDRNVASTPLIMLTSYSERREVEEARQVGVLVYLIKPVRKRQLRQAVDRALRRVEAEADTPAAAAKPAVVQRQRKLLLVEDNIDNQKLALRLLNKGGYECDLASNGAEALEKVFTVKYSLILMDCQMPVMDGFQATAAIREREGNTRRTPIVAMTAHSLQGYREKCLEAGMDDYVSKPVNEKLLFRTIERWVFPVEAAAPAPGPPEPEPRFRVPAEVGMEDLIPEFLSNRKRDVEALAIAVSSGRLTDVQRIGHGMKGSGAGYGFPEITNIGKNLETAARASDLPGIRQQIAVLADYLDRVEVVY